MVAFCSQIGYTKYIGSFWREEGVSMFSKTYSAAIQGIDAHAIGSTPFTGFNFPSRLNSPANNTFSKHF